MCFLSQGLDYPPRCARRTDAMENYALLVGLIGAILVYVAWQERTLDNRRDSRLLYGLALATLAGSASLLLG